MTNDDTGTGEASEDRGAATARGGTPFAVDPSGHQRSQSTLALLLSGPVIWTGHFLLVYLVVEAGCTGGGPGLAVFNPPVPAVVTIVATAVAVLACLGCAALAYRRWRADRTARASPTSEATVSLAAVAVGLCLLGVVTVLFVGLPAVVFVGC